jgi:hypothetical protein
MCYRRSERCGKRTGHEVSRKRRQSQGRQTHLLVEQPTKFELSINASRRRRSGSRFRSRCYAGRTR